MSIERQPGRPTEDEFTGAAVRFLNDDYKTQVMHIMCGYFANVHEVAVGRSYDVDIIKRELDAEGKPGEPDSLRDFAVRQLSYYQKARKH